MFKFMERLRHRRTIKWYRAELWDMGIDVSGKTDEELGQMLMEFTQLMAKAVESYKATIEQMGEAIQKVIKAMKELEEVPHA